MARSPKIDEGVSTLTEKWCQSTTPSKVVHFRNLPNQCSDEELIQLCSPFGKVVDLSCCVGPKKNQGFVEFEDINQAISMVSYYNSSSNSAQLHNNTIYIQYSERQEIVIGKYAKGNILIVSMEGVQAGDVSIEALHSVFSAFGFVQKISTFEKSERFQALIQFSDIKTASSAKAALDGKSMPRYLLPNYVDGCNLHISYSEHKDLNVKFQSNRSRDYTNPTLPVNQASIDRALQPIPRPTENHVLWATFQNMQYDITVDALHAVFSKIGTVQKISIFEKNDQTHALIQYPDVATATAAKIALDGHCIYDGGYCKLRLSYSRHTDIFVKGFNDKSRDYTRPNHNVFGDNVPATTMQNPHVAPMYPYNSVHALQAQVHGGQIPSWNPIYSYMFVPGTFLAQTYAVPPYPAYALCQTNPMVQNENYMEITPPGVPGFSTHIQADFVGFLPLGVNPYYYGY